MSNEKTAPKTATQRQAEMRERRKNKAIVTGSIETSAKRFHEIVWSNFTGNAPAETEILGMDAAGTLSRFVDMYEKQQVFIELVLPRPVAVQLDDEPPARDVTKKASKKKSVEIKATENSP